MDETKDVPVTLEYQENNYYHKSKINDELVITLVPTYITIEITLADKNVLRYDLNNRNPSLIYYSDRVDAKAIIRIKDTNYVVTDGSVDFFFVKDDDGEQFEYQINKSPIPLTNGVAVAQFVPRGNGRVIVRYHHEDSFFQDSESGEDQGQIILTPLPTVIEFFNKSETKYNCPRQNGTVEEIEKINNTWEPRILWYDPATPSSLINKYLDDRANQPITFLRQVNDGIQYPPQYYANTFTIPVKLCNKMNWEFTANVNISDYCRFGFVNYSQDTREFFQMNANNTVTTRSYNYNSETKTYDTPFNFVNNFHHVKLQKIDKTFYFYINDKLICTEDIRMPGDPRGHTTLNDHYLCFWTHGLTMNSLKIKLLSVDLQDVYNDNSPFVDPYSTIDMNVRVFLDDKDKTPVSYGVVTFLHYFTYGLNNPLLSTEERVIGNPIFLNEKGEGVITYSPMQLETTQEYIKYYTNEDNYDANLSAQEIEELKNEYLKEIFKNIEFIQATYNYDNEIYGEKWHYYDDSSDWGYIAIARPNTINVSAPTHNIDGIETPLKVGKDLLFTAKANEGISFTFYLSDDNGDIIDFDQDIYSGQSENISSNLLNEIFNIVFESVSDNYEQDKQSYECVYDSETKIFTVHLNTNQPGVYKFYIEIIKENMQEVVKQTVSLDANNLNDSNVLYLQASSSEPVYIRVDYENGSLINMELNLEDQNQSYIINKDNNKNFYIDFSSIMEENEEEKLIDADCYFLIDNQEKISTKIIRKNTANEQKICTESINLGEFLSSEGNHIIQAYIKEGVYNNTHFSQLFSNQITIFSRQQRNYHLNVATKKSEYPGKIQYNIYVENDDVYKDSVNTNITLLKDNEEILSWEDVTISNKNVTRIIDNLAVGEYSLIIESNDNKYCMETYRYNNITIDKKSITLTLPNTISTAENQTLTVVTDVKENIDDIQPHISDISFKLTNNSGSINIPTENIEILIKNNQLVIFLKNITFITKPTNYILTASCENDNIKLTNNSLNFIATDAIPQFSINFINEGIEIIMTDYNNNIINKEFLLTNIELFGGIDEQIIAPFNKKSIYIKEEMINDDEESYEEENEGGIVLDDEENEGGIIFEEEQYYSVIIKKEDVGWESDESIHSCKYISFNFNKDLPENQNIIGYTSTIIDKQILR